MRKKRKVTITATIDELEAILNSEEEFDIQINADGSITTKPKGKAKNKIPKVLTMREALGGKYCKGAVP